MFKAVEGESAVALVLETVPLGASGRQRQDAVATVERLNGGLLIHAKHGGMARRIEVETDDVGGFALEVGVVGGHVALQPMRLEVGFPPNTMNQVFADAEFFAEFAAGPVGRTVARLAAGGIEDFGAQADGEFRWWLPWAVGFQSVESVFEEAFLPFPDGRRGAIEFVGDSGVGEAVGE